MARENYDKAFKRIGVNKVALITGEEKFIPKEAKYFFCTVESIPKNLNVECIVIDEIQLASDYERGHIFTEHLLNTRGEFETMFLGSLTMKVLLIEIVFLLLRHDGCPPPPYYFVFLFLHQMI